jgi:hypothetical protein
MIDDRSVLNGGNFQFFLFAHGDMTYVFLYIIYVCGHAYRGNWMSSMRQMMA